MNGGLGGKYSLFEYGMAWSGKVSIIQGVFVNEIESTNGLIFSLNGVRTSVAVRH